MSHDSLSKHPQSLSGSISMLSRCCEAYAYACSRCDIVSVACMFGGLGCLWTILLLVSFKWHENSCMEQQSGI